MSTHHHLSVRQCWRSFLGEITACYIQSAQYWPNAEWIHHHSLSISFTTSGPMQKTIAPPPSLSHTCTHTHCVPNVHDYCINPPSISPTTDNVTASTLPPSHQPQTMLLYQPSLHLTNHRQCNCINPPSISPTTDNVTASTLPPSHQPQTM